MENKVAYLVKYSDKYLNDSVFCVSLSEEDANKVIRDLEKTKQQHKNNYLSEYGTAYDIDRNNWSDRENRWRAQKYEKDFPVIAWKYIWMAKIDIL